MKHSDFLSGARDEAFRLFNLGRGMKHPDFSSEARDEAFRLLIWGKR